MDFLRASPRAWPPRRAPSFSRPEASRSDPDSHCRPSSTESESRSLTSPLRTACGALATTEVATRGALTATEAALDPATKPICTTAPPPWTSRASPLRITRGALATTAATARGALAAAETATRGPLATADAATRGALAATAAVRRITRGALEPAPSAAAPAQLGTLGEPADADPAGAPPVVPALLLSALFAASEALSAQLSVRAGDQATSKALPCFVVLWCSSTVKSCVFGESKGGMNAGYCCNHESTLSSVAESSSDAVLAAFASRARSWRAEASVGAPCDSIEASWSKASKFTSAAAGGLAPLPLGPGSRPAASRQLSSSGAAAATSRRIRAEGLRWVN